MSNSMRNFGIAFLIFILCSVFVYYLGGRCRTVCTKQDKVRVELDLFKSYLEAFKTENGRYPTVEESLQEITGNKENPKDPWGSPYIYLSPSLNGKESFSLYSIGPNKIDEKGEGDDIVCCAR